ncbi:MAG: hypothetical protein HQ575_04425 [Candidatus Omnitrophica bacterium]|nr:hypothetical protein [Candidatus Omnitrophota bacterium]
MIKFKSLIVIILSSILISLVILLTILGLSLFIGWKEGESARRHMDIVSQQNAQSYGQLISIHNLQAVQENKGPHEGKYLLQGTIKNSGYRTVSSVSLLVDFLNSGGDTVYNENLLPLKAPAMPRTATIAALSLFTSGKESPLLPGKNTRFKCVLNEQRNKDVVSPIKSKRFATNPNEWSGKFDYRVTKVKF